MATPSSPHRWKQGHRHDRFRARQGVLVIAAALAVMLVGASVESSTHNVEASTDDVETSIEPGDPAAAFYARDYSVSEAEARRRLDRLDGIYEVIGPIRNLEAERLAGWGIDHADTLTGWVWLTGSAAPSSEAAALADAHTDVEIRLGASHSLQDLLKAQDSFGDGSEIGPVGQVTEQPRAVIDYSDIITFTDVDMDNNALHIGIDPALAPTTLPSGSLGGLLDDDTPSMGTGGATDAELRKAIKELESDFQGSISVAYKVVDGRNIADDATFDAGQSMFVDSSGACTSGFAARLDGTNTYGIITAGHCSGNLQVNGVTLPWVRGYKNITADAEFRKIPSGKSHVLRSRVAYGDQGTSVQITSKVRRSEMKGRYVCKQGMNSGLSCGRVTSINHRPTRDGACLAAHNRIPTACGSVFVKVHGPGLKSCNGDSGGPWFSFIVNSRYTVSKAYGIHKSSNSENVCTRKGVHAVFSAIDEVEEFLDATILINRDITLINYP